MLAKGPIDRKLLARKLLKYDVSSLIHGMFLAKDKLAGGRLRVARALTAFIEADGVKVAASGGSKQDHVDPTGKAFGQGGAEKGFGHVPFPRDRKRDVLPLMEHALPTMALFRRALLSKVGDEQMRGACPELTGKDEHGGPLRDPGHGHAHFIPLSLDERNRGRIDHVLVYASTGFHAVAQRALRRLRKTWAKGIEDVAVTLVGLGRRQLFLEVGDQFIPELATSATWASRTPFIPARYLKSRGKDSLEGQVRAELRRRGLPDLVAPPAVTLPTRGDADGREARDFRHFIRTRREKRSDAPPGLFHLTLTLEQPIPGPLCLGWGSHFGLGVFVAREP